MQTVLFVPGFGEGRESRDYAAVLKAIERTGRKAVFVPIRWKRTTIYEWVAELERVYETCDPEGTILAGFSFGAMTALVAASKTVPAELWLFSLSPYFMEDLPNVPSAWLRAVGKKRTMAFRNTSFGAIAPKINCPVWLFVGEEETKKWPCVAQRFNAACQKFKEYRRVEVKNAGHQVDHPDYIAAIKDNL